MSKISKEKPINWLDVSLRIAAGEKAAIIAFRYELPLESFYSRFKTHFGIPYSEYAPGRRECGIYDITTRQYVLAMEGHPKMLEILGREWCKQGVEASAKEVPKEDVIDLRQEIMQLKNIIRKAGLEDKIKAKPKAKAVDEE